MENYKSKFTGEQIDFALEKSLNNKNYIIFKIMDFSELTIYDSIPAQYTDTKFDIITEEMVIPGYSGNYNNLWKNLVYYNTEENLMYFLDEYQIYQNYSEISHFYVKTKEPETPKENIFYLLKDDSNINFIQVFIVNNGILKNIKALIDSEYLLSTINNLSKLVNKLEENNNQLFSKLIAITNELNISNYCLYNEKEQCVFDNLLEALKSIEHFFNNQYNNFPTDFRIKFYNNNNQWVTYRATEDIMYYENIEDILPYWELVTDNLFIVQ